MVLEQEPELAEAQEQEPEPERHKPPGLPPNKEHLIRQLVSFSFVPPDYIYYISAYLRLGYYLIYHIPTLFYILITLVYHAIL